MDILWFVRHNANYEWYDFQIWFTERKNKIEEGNRILVQKFQSQLNQQLDILHKSVVASVMQQETQLKEMEEDMQSFVSTKSKV